MKVISTLFLVLLFCTSYVQAKDALDLPSVVDKALNRFEQTPRYDWSFVKESHEDEEGELTELKEIFTPSGALADGWQLVTYNGKPPSKKRLKKYRKNIQKRYAQETNSKAEEGEEQSFSINIRNLIEMDSLTLSSETETQWVIAFNVLFNEMGIDAEGNLDGLLYLDKRAGYIEKIAISNNDSFSPAFSAKITQLNLTLAFTNIEENILPLEVSMIMKGTFAFMAEINETQTTRYTDYRYQPYNIEAVSSN